MVATTYMGSFDCGCAALWRSTTFAQDDRFMKLTLARVAEFVSAAGEFAPDVIAQGYSIDSRSVGPGQLFFAVKGERLDGHDFVGQALEKGAVAAVVRRDQLGRYPAGARSLAVEDTLVALQTLATAVR